MYTFYDFWLLYNQIYNAVTFGYYLFFYRYDSVGWGGSGVGEFKAMGLGWGVKVVWGGSDAGRVVWGKSDVKVNFFKKRNECELGGLQKYVILYGFKFNFIFFTCYKSNRILFIMMISIKLLKYSR